MCFINQQANNCTQVHNPEPTMHASHRAVIIIMNQIFIPTIQEPQFSSQSASPPAQRQMERTRSWLWRAFTSCEHLSITFNMSCHLKLCHIWKIHSSQTVRWKAALNEGFSALLRSQFPSPTSLTRACCHLVDSHRLVPLHSKCH